MIRKSLLLGTLIGILIGNLVGSVMVYVGWLEIRVGVFRNELAADWGNLLDTRVSWFIPIAVIAIPMSLAVLSWKPR